MTAGAADVDSVVNELRSLGSAQNRAGMARFGINTEQALGISITSLRPLQRAHRGDHALALALWRTGFHEARILAALIDDARAVTGRQMDAWVADFDSWDLE